MPRSTAFRAVLAFLLILGLGTATARADAFSDAVDLSPLQTIAVQDRQTVKTFDTYARQAVNEVTGRSTIKGDGVPALFSVLDMSFRPDRYVTRNLIKIANVPLRKEFLVLDGVDDPEKDRIVKEGTISLQFFVRPDVQALIEKVQSADVQKAKAIGEMMNGAGTMARLCGGPTGQMAGLLPVALIAPATDGADDTNWHQIAEIGGNVPAVVDMLKAQGKDAPKPLPNYDTRTAVLSDVLTAWKDLQNAWAAGNAQGVNAAAAALATALPQVNPAAYPSSLKRTVEVTYNRLMKLTIPGAALYFVAFVFFLCGARAGVLSLRLWGLRFMAIALLVHTLGIGVRWWLVGDIFPPIKNEFESVMFSAWFGAVVGIILEFRKPRGVFGAAASFVGCLALVAIFAAPYAAGRDIGGEIEQVNGVLMSYWLYVHVTMVTASYALIGMGFALSAWWLTRYYRDYGTLRRVPGNLMSSDAARGAFDVLPDAGGGGAITAGFTGTLAQMLFVRAARVQAPVAVARKAVAAEGKSAQFLATLDLCNLVVLQLAFWVLGVGIVLGAIWADQSWGRPWGWDPKETFALVTWIVYLIVVHVRVATEHKAWWTAVLSCIGFFVMLFNWIGVNFFLVGLHSYA